MKMIELRNKELIGILDRYMDVMIKQERGSWPVAYRGIDIQKKKYTGDEACSIEYLQYMQSKPPKSKPPEGVDGFPEETRGLDLLHVQPPGMKQALETLDNELMAWSGTRFCAVKMYYPAQGFMSWHHNANCPGYNILLSWSKNGTGFFRYQDPITKEIITMQDVPGWTVKVGYYGSWDEHDKIYWHCANAPEEERFTLGYVIPHEGLWKDMYNDIETP